MYRDPLFQAYPPDVTSFVSCHLAVFVGSLSCSSLGDRLVGWSKSRKRTRFGVNLLQFYNRTLLAMLQATSDGLQRGTYQAQPILFGNRQKPFEHRGHAEERRGALRMVRDRGSLLGLGELRVTRLVCFGKEEGSKDATTVEAIATSSYLLLVARTLLGWRGTEWTLETCV